MQGGRAYPRADQKSEAELHSTTSQLAHQALRVYCRGSINGSQPGKKPPTFEIHRRCGMVDVLHTPHLESGGGCKVRGEGSTGLYVANLLCVWA